MDIRQVNTLIWWVGDWAEAIPRPYYLMHNESKYYNDEKFGHLIHYQETMFSKSVMKVVIHIAQSW